MEVIGLTRYEQYVDTVTDTTIYTFNKMITLLLSCNPNTLELLGLNEEHYLYLSILKDISNSRQFYCSVSSPAHTSFAIRNTAQAFGHPQ